MPSTSTQRRREQCTYQIKKGPASRPPAGFRPASGVKQAELARSVTAHSSEKGGWHWTLGGSVAEGSFSSLSSPAGVDECLAPRRLTCGAVICPPTPRFASEPGRACGIFASSRETTVIELVESLPVQVCQPIDILDEQRIESAAMIALLYLKY